MTEAPHQSEETTWDTEDVARFLKSSTETVRRRMKDSGLPYNRVGRLLRFDKAAVEQWFRDQQQDEAA